jgi:hypothetical protein
MYHKIINTNITIKEHIYSANLCKQLYNNSKKNTMMVYKKRENSLFVVLQGTNSICHWIHNFALFPTKDEGLHSGFKQYANLCKQELINTIYTHNKNMCYNDVNKIYFTAHSLGASAIIILVYQLLKEGIFSNYIKDIDIEIVLFGAPKSGNIHFIKNFESILKEYQNIKLYRYNVKYDFIKYYPPILTYSHICNEITLDNSSVKKTDLFYNHSINCYIDCITNNLD